MFVDSGGCLWRFAWFPLCSCESYRVFFRASPLTLLLAVWKSFVEVFFLLTSRYCQLIKVGIHLISIGFDSGVLQWVQSN